MGGVLGARVVDAVEPGNEEDSVGPGESCDGVIDLAALERLHRWGGEALQEKMIRIFLRSSADLLQQIRDGLEHGATDEVHRAAHSLKSTSATVGAVRLSDLAADIEASADEGALDRARDRLPSIMDAHEKVSVCLRDFLSGQAERS